MKKLVITFALALLLGAMLAFSVSAAEITVTDDGTGNITLGECVIEGIDVEIPQASRGFTFVLDTVKQTAKITKWDGYATDSIFAIPSTVTYEGTVYTVDSFNRVIFGTDNGKGAVSNSNYVVTHIFVPDTVKALPASAFAEMRALEYVYIGAGVESIGEKCFVYSGFTAGGYYVTVDKEVVNEETGEVTHTTETKSIEAAGGKMGNIKAFVWTTRKLTELTKECFHHMEFDKNAVIKFPLEDIVYFRSNCMSYNQHAFAQAHYFQGVGMFFDVFDLTDKDSANIASDAFSNAVLSSTIILRADQLHLVNATKLRGQGTAHYDPMNVCFIIYGGDTAESAVTMSGALWVANAWYWHPGNIYYRMVFKGYVNAYDGVDGLENQNGYGKDVLDYYFESVEKMNHYFASIATTSKASDTYARLAKNSKGYFNVCVGDGTAVAYNIKQNSDTGAYYIEEYSKATSCPTRLFVLGDDCTPSSVCACCGYVAEKGIAHNIVTEIIYANGYLQAGAKVTYCTNGCGLSESVSVGAIFRMLGYSVAEFGNGGIVQGFYVNEEALSVYMEQSSDFKFGVVASTSAVPFDKDGAPVNDKVVYHEMTGGKHNAFEIKLVGLSAYADIPVVACGYVIDGGNVYYLDNGKTLEKPIFASYNELISK